MAVNDTGDELGEPIDFDKEILDKIWDEIHQEEIATGQARPADPPKDSQKSPQMTDELTTKEMNRILCEVTMGKRPTTPDTPEMAKFRAQMKKEVKEIKDKGYEVQIPNE